MFINKGLIFTLLCLCLTNNNISRSDEASDDYPQFSIDDTCDYVTTGIQETCGPLEELSDLDSDITEERFFKLVDDILMGLRTIDDPELRKMIFFFLVEVIIRRANNQDFRDHCISVSL